MRFGHNVVVNWQELRDELHRRTYGVELPLVIVPYHEDAEDVIHGRLGADLPHVLAFLASVRHGLAVQEDGLPVVGL